MNKYVPSQMIYYELKMTNNVSKSSQYIRIKYQIYAMMNYTDENKMLEVKRSNLYSSAIFYRFIFSTR